ncbi:very short patch repair endonuclease [Sphingomonas prati]|uniref:very short patch repair endonuclease n=1 Tax=Sphingomonas prati TaxID=1843237 RepID=UPI0012F66231|nr:very short patch repair endonuclease [Sphingomonas prati]
MVDVVDAATRSRMMSGIRGRNTKPEIQLRSGLHALGYRFRLHAKGLPGKPDIVLPKYRAVVLVHGCFWHRHQGCRYATTPATRTEFWSEKFAGNVLRDARNASLIKSAGWRLATVWECALRSDGGHEVARLVSEWLRSDRTELEIPSCLLTERSG